ncbi:phosphatase PAP2 family protein [uncultured Sanguibacteroides sp.]|uniref:phosphatase PAP2 family protein n=1 Tax=uncultured Sanguibacteroides sp. TaxID=1635151 RepID=UPI0025F11A10|nr:phosphatase PAP2 family protein [uncultured Sanguibacteroides sp.]
MILSGLLFIQPLQAQRKAIRTTGDALFFVAPVTAFTMTLLKKDYEGTKQLVFSGVTAVGLTYILKYSISKERPDKSDDHSFPSAHTSISFTGASFLQRRYGWKFGVPAYLLSTYVAWSRVYGKKHDWWDVLAGTAIGVGSTYIFTKPFGKTTVSITPAILDKYPGIHASITF